MRWDRVARTAAVGGGGVVVTAGAAYGVLKGEARLARRTVGPPKYAAPDATGWYGDRPGPPLRLAILGDSSAAGIGVTRVDDTPGALLAAALASELRRRVELRVVAFSGAKSADLAMQVAEVLYTARPEVAIIQIGANDVTHLVPPSAAVIPLAAAVRRLRDAGATVIVCTCPDLGTVKPVLQPLRTVARRRSRQMARAQTVAVVEAGGTAVSLGEMLGREFDQDPTLFSEDRFHPSAQGYARLAETLLPVVCEAVLGPAIPPVEAGDVVEPVSVAALDALDAPGTEVSGTEVAGRERGARGRWVRLRRRPADDGTRIADEAAGTTSSTGTMHPTLATQDHR